MGVGADHPCFTEVLANFASLEMSPVLKGMGFVLFLSFPFEFELLLVDAFAERKSKPGKHMVVDKEHTLQIFEDGLEVSFDWRRFLHCYRRRRVGREE